MVMNIGQLLMATLPIRYIKIIDKWRTTEAIRPECSIKMRALAPSSAEVIVVTESRQQLAADPAYGIVTPIPRMIEKMLLFICSGATD